MSENRTAERASQGNGIAGGQEKKGSQSKLKRYVQRGKKMTKNDTIAR